MCDSISELPQPCISDLWSVRKGFHMEQDARCLKYINSQATITDCFSSPHMCCNPQNPAAGRVWVTARASFAALPWKQL